MKPGVKDSIWLSSVGNRDQRSGHLLPSQAARQEAALEAEQLGLEPALLHRMLTFEVAGQHTCATVLATTPA